MTASPASTSELLGLLRSSGLLTTQAMDALSESDFSPSAERAAGQLVERGVITPFQSRLLLQGKYKGFRLGSYVIQEVLGRGGMGTVYLAEHQELRRKVAIKVLIAGKEEEAKVNQDRFLREARAAAALDHPNIVRIFDVVRAGHTLYLVMEHVTGENLQQLLTQRGKLPFTEAVEAIAQAAAGLQHAHEKGFVHRDIKPANLMLETNGTVKILDMGLARSNESAEDKLTEQLEKGAILGTADYISPEQALNSDVDIRADIYSLGATFFALVTGKPPFEGSTTQKLLQHQIKELPRLPLQDATLPDGMMVVIAKMLAKKREQRYATPLDVIAALEPWLSAGSRAMPGLSKARLADSSELQLGVSDALKSTSSRRLDTRPGSSSALFADSLPQAARETSDALGMRTPSPQQNLPRPHIEPPTQPLPSVWGESDVESPRRSRKRLVVGVAALLVVGGALAFFLAGPSGPSNPQAQGLEPVDPVQVPPKPQPQTVEVASTKPTLVLEAAKLPMFALKLEGRKVLAGDAAVLPKTLFAYSGLSTGQGEVARVELPDGPAVKIASTEGMPSCNLAIDLEPPGTKPLTRAATYSFQIEYRTDKDGKMLVLPISQRLQSLTTETVFGSTKGEWKTVRMEFRRGVDPFKLVLRANSRGLENAIYVRRVEFLETAGPSISPPNGGLLMSLSSRMQSGFSNTAEYPLMDDGKTKGSRTVNSGNAGRPANYTCRATVPGGQAEFCYDESIKAFEIRNLAGPGGACMYSPYFTSPSGAVRLQMEFQYTGIPGQARVLFHGNNNTNLSNSSSLMELAVPRNTKPNEWVKLDVSLDLRDQTSGQIEIVNWDPQPDAPLRFRNYSLSEVPLSSVPSVIDVGVAYAVDMAAIPEFRVKKQGTRRLEGDTEPLPPSVKALGGDTKSVSEFSRTTIDGVPCLGLVALQSDKMQYYFEAETDEAPIFKPGQRYQVRMTYRSGDEVHANLTLLTPNRDSSPVLKSRTLASARLAPSPTWRTVTADFVRGKDTPVRFTVHPKTLGTIFVKSFEVVEVK